MGRAVRFLVAEEFLDVSPMEKLASRGALHADGARMQYGTFRAHGYRVGSGVTNGASTVQATVKSGAALPRESAAPACRAG